MRTTMRWAHSRYGEASTFWPIMDPEQRERGLITASTGNHGQSVANACRIFGVKAVVVVPEGANPLKVRSMRNLGAAGPLPRRKLRPGPGVQRAAGQGRGLPLRSRRQRADAGGGRGHLRPGDSGGVPRSGVHPRAPGWGQRSRRMLHSCQGGQSQALRLLPFSPNRLRRPICRGRTKKSATRP